MNIVDAIGIAFEVDTSELDKGLKKAQDKVSSFAKHAGGKSIFDFNNADYKNRIAELVNLYQTGKQNSFFFNYIDYSRDFIAELMKAQQPTKNIGTYLAKAGAEAHNLFVILRGVFASTLFAGALAWISKFIISFSDMKKEVLEINELSKQVSGNIEDISAWSNAVEFNGGNAKSFQSTLVSLQKDLNNFSVTGKSKNQPILAMLGIDINEASGKPIFDLIGDITKAVEGMDKAQSKNILAKLGFDNDTIEFIQSGTKNVDKLIAKQKEWGVYTKKDTEALDKMDKSIKQMSLALKSTFIPLFTRIIQVSSKIVIYITKAALWLRDNLDIVRKAVLLLALAFSSKLYKAIQLLGAKVAKNPFVLYIAGLTMLLLLLEDFYGYTQGKKSAFAGLWEKMGDPKKAAEKVDLFLGTMQKLGDILDSAIGKWLVISGVIGKLLFSFNGLNLAIAGIPLAMGTAATVALALLIGFVYVYREELLGAFNFFKNAILDIPNIIKALINELSPVASEIADFLTNPIPKIKKAWEDLKEWFIKEFGSLDKIMNRMVTEGHAARVAKEATGGGNSGNTEITDNRKVDVTINATTKEAGEGAVNRAISYSKLADSGVGP